MSRQAFPALILCGLVLLGLTALGLWLQSQDRIGTFVAVAMAQGAMYLAAVRIGIGSGLSARRVVPLVLGFALAMRALLVAAPPYLSTDIYRYIWDGRVIAAGVNPYRYTPTDPHLAPLRDPDIFPNINRANYAHTIYPPAAEAIFFAVTRVSASVTAMKAAMVLFEAVAVALLLRLFAARGQPASRIILYAWHPLPLWEFAGSGHIDAAIVALIALALWSRQRPGRRTTDAGTDPHPALPRKRGRVRVGAAGAMHLRLPNSITTLALAAATLVKFYPAALMPALWRRGERAMPFIFVLAVVAAYLPFLGVGWGVFGFLPAYLGEEGFASGGTGFYLWAVARTMLPLGGISLLAYVGIAAALGGGLALWVARRRLDPAAGAALIAGLFMLLLSPHYPWYFAWLVVFACLVPSAALLWLTLASFLLYLVPVGSQLVWDRPRLLVETALYLPFMMLAAADLLRRRRRLEQLEDAEPAPS
ncbi:MAG TPA: glycosyltransferase 87 family protein [Stellaceae bacterium]|nr:glycosyltransferase 87 family protein [Stellaceae bacterium]